MSLYILTLAEMKQELAIEDEKDDSLLTQHMEGLQDRLDEYLRRKLLRASDTEYFDGGLTELCLRRYPVESVDSVHESLDQDWDSGSLLAADGYRVNLERGTVGYGLYGMDPWPAGRQNIRVIYTGGFVATGTSPGAGQTAMPEAIRRAMRMQMGFEWRNRLNLGKRSASAQGFYIQLAPAELLEEVRGTLQPFRRILI